MNNITHSTIPQDSQDEMPRLSQQAQVVEEVKQQQAGNGSVESRMLSAAQNNDKKELQYLMHANGTVRIVELVNQKSFTLLHFATFNNQEEIAMVIINHVRSQSPHELSRYVNKQTSDGFTCLHFAAYRGNLNLLRVYEELGAEVQVLNQHGMNIMHIAAQGDQPIGIMFASERGILATQLDNKGGSPLHWACFYGCEQATVYLLAIIKKRKDHAHLVNHLDEQGLSPLHLAVMSGNSRLIKKLLIAGADKTQRGKKGVTPAELALEHEYQNIHNMIANEENCCLQYYNIKQTLRPIRKTRWELLKFALLLLYELGTYVIFKNVENLRTLARPSFTLTLTDVVLFSLSALSLLQFLLISSLDPGYQKKRPDDILRLLEKYECYELCPHCNLIKLPRSKHCDICQRCVMVYDHHCPWINNCIGAKNHGFFLLFILTLIANILFLLYSLIYNMLLFYINHDFLYQDYYEYIRVVLLGINCLIGLLFTAALLLLTITQMINFLKGQTTLERFQLKNGSSSLVSAQKTTNASLKTSLLSKYEYHYEMRNFLDFCYRNYRFYRQKEKEQVV